MKSRISNYRRRLGGTIFIVLLSLGLSGLSNAAQAQERNQRQKESMLTSRKWTLIEVSRKKLTKLKKMDGFRMEEGNEMSFSIDHKFGYKNNDYEYMAGKWIYDGKELLLVHDARDMTNRLENSRYKIKKLSSVSLILKRMDKPRGVLTFK